MLSAILLNSPFTSIDCEPNETKIAAEMARVITAIAIMSSSVEKPEYSLFNKIVLP
jgi:hypothetical protein